MSEGTSSTNHLFYVLANGDVVYKFNDVHFVVRSRKLLERVESTKYISKLPSVFIHEPTPTWMSCDILKPLGIPIFSQIYKHHERYLFRKDYRPYVIGSASDGLGFLQLYVLAGSKYDYIRTKLAFKFDAIAPQPYHEHGTVSLLVYLSNDKSKRPILSLVTGDCSTKRIERAIFNAVDSKKIPYFRWEDETFYESAHPVVEIYNEERTREEIRREQILKRLRINLPRQSHSIPEPVPETYEYSQTANLPFIDEEGTEEQPTCSAKSQRDGYQEPGSSSERPSDCRRGSQLDSGVDSMPSPAESQVGAINDFEITSLSDEEEEAEKENPVVRRGQFLSFDVIHMPPYAEKIGRFFKKFKADYYILPTGKYNGFTSGKAIQLNKNIRSGCRIIPTEQAVDNGWHDGKVKTIKTAEGMKRIYKIFEPIRIEDEPAIYKEIAYPYGVEMMKLTFNNLDHVPPPDVYKQQTVVLGGIVKDGVSFPLWPEKLTLPRKIQKIFNLKCTCKYCRYNLDQFFRP